ncbi:MAG: radical SAM family heme chaperone HemW [Acidobacteriota bacterium]
MEVKTKAGLYIHFPFCIRKCSYCHFYSIKKDSNQIKKWMNGIFKEMDFYDEEFEFDTVYLGGGSPSLLENDLIEKFFAKIYHKFPFKFKEITIEAIPFKEYHETLKLWRKIGIDRISIGVQSFLKEELKILEREYSPEDVIDFYGKAREAGFENINLDFLIGIPNQNLKKWKKNFDFISLLHPEHVSIYILESLEDTEFKKIHGDFQKEEEIEELFFGIEDWLISLGYYHYEISNYAKKGMESLHNLKYWNDQPFIGIGPSASSYNLKSRWENIDDFSLWIKLLEAGKKPIKQISFLTDEEILKDAILMGLRKIEGLNIKKYEDVTGENIREKFESKWKELSDLDLIEIDKETIKIKRKKLLLANEVFREFI